MKKRLPTIILIVVFFTGLSLLLYPAFSDYWNSLHQSRAIASYMSDVAALDNDTHEALLTAARNYNADIARNGIQWKLSDREKAVYDGLLNPFGNGIIGYIEIGKIGCSLPIYHGTAEGVLQIAAGHIEGTSLPIGGESTHAVISGHRGLPSAKLFTDLDKMVVGDTFLIHVLDETLTYEVDQILIVEPYEVEAMEIEQGKAYCTLVTCTPYGVNTHRLLVRGHRIENAEEAKTVRVTSDAFQIEPMIVAPLVAAPILLVLLVIVFIRSGKRSNGRK